MSEQTQRWMKRELDELLAQRARYVMAERASRRVHQKVQHTRQRLRLDQEILGRREALRALEEQAEATPRDPGLLRPQVAAAPSASDRATLPLALGVCVTTFALGFVLVGNLLTPEQQAVVQPPPEAQPLRYRPLGPAMPVRVPKRSDDPVMAAAARPRSDR